MVHISLALGSRTKTLSTNRFEGFFLGHHQTNSGIAQREYPEFGRLGVAGAGMANAQSERQPLRVYSSARASCAQWLITTPEVVRELLRSREKTRNLSDDPSHGIT